MLTAKRGVGEEGEKVWVSVSEPHQVSITRHNPVDLSFSLSPRLYPVPRPGLAPIVRITYHIPSR